VDVIHNVILKVKIKSKPPLPDDHNNAIKDVIGISQIWKEAKGSEFENHLQGEHTGKHDVTNLQDISQFIRL